MNHPTLRATLSLLGLVALTTLLGGCYTRAQLPAKATPPTAKIALDFTTDPGLNAQALTRNANGEPVNAAQVQQLQASLNAVPTKMVATLKQDLLRYRVGYPVVSADDADLQLSGVFRADPMGVALDWQMTDLASGAVVSAGTHTVTFFTGNTDPYADAVLSDLLVADVDRFAGRSGATSPPPSGGSGGGLGQPPASAHDGSNTWVVAVGVERYRDDLPEALHAEADARAFAQFAETTLGVPPRQIKLLLNERAGKADLSSVLEEWLPRNATKPGGTVFIYFSGHGAPDPETGDAYLVPWDADPAYIKTRGYAIARVYENLGALKNQQVIALFDACFSGSGDRSVLAKGTRPLVPVKDVRPTGVIAFSASAANQTTGASPNSQHGLFTHHLLAGMYGEADANGDATINLGELSNYVSSRVTRDARLDNREQEPTLQLPRGVQPGRVTLLKGLK